MRHWHTPHENGLQFADIVSETVSPYRLLIGGDWIEGGSGTYGVVNPATEDVVDEAPEASASDARAAAAAVRCDPNSSSSDISSSETIA